MKNSKGKQQHNFTEQTTKEIFKSISTQRQNSRGQQASHPHAKSLAGINRTKNLSLHKQNQKQIYRAGKPHRQY